jgi:plastocyanin
MRRQLAVHALAGILLAGAAGCGGGPKTVAVTVQGLTFPPVKAQPGAEIKLMNKDPEPHTMTADDNTSFASTPFTAAEPQMIQAPKKKGVYPFHCTVHPPMHGTLTVK